MEPQQCQVTAPAQSLRLSKEDPLQSTADISRSDFRFYLETNEEVFVLIYLENVGQVSQVECVVKLDGCGQEAVSHPVVQADGGLNHSGSTSLNRHAEELLLQVAVEDLAEDGPLRLG